MPEMLRAIAFVRLIIPFCAGIALFIFLPYHPDVSIAYIAFASCVALLLGTHYLLLFKKAFRQSWIAGVMMHVVFFMAGYLLCASRTEIDNPHHFSHFTTGDSELLLQIDEPPAETERHYKTVCKVLAVQDEGTVHRTTGKVQVYLYKNRKVTSLRYGDRLWARNKFNELTPPKNPGEFNYKRFMGFRQVYHQAFLAGGDWTPQEGRGGNPLVAFALGLRSHLLGVLRTYVHEEQAYAVASSLILGMREKMDDDLMQAYSSSGTLHVLSVSGLHVAIMFEIFALLFIFLDRNPRTKILKSIIIVLIIWVYAILTGLSPSVLRSAVMFTFIAFGTSLKRPANIYNLLACSAFALLIYNPYYLMEVGFQLSYVAVAGIVMLYPKIYPVVYVPNKALDWFWKIIPVSIAAQLATLPLILLYFKQFPVYFLLANLLVIPVSTGVLYVGVTLFAFSMVPGLNTVLGFCLEKLLWVMNAAVLYIDSLPYALFEGVYLDIPQSALLYFSILTAIGFIYWKRSALLIASLAGMLLLMGWKFTDAVRHEQQRRIVVYSVNRRTAIDFISGTEHLFLADSALLHDDKRMLYSVKHNWWNNGLQSNTAGIGKPFSLSFAQRQGEYIQFLNKRIVLLDKSLAKTIPVEKLSVDYVILSKNVKVKLDDLLKFYNFRMIIFDSSNSKPRVKKWKLDCERLGLNCYDVQERGAYVEDF